MEGKTFLQKTGNGPEMSLDMTYDGYRAMLVDIFKTKKCNIIYFLGDE